LELYLFLLLLLFVVVLSEGKRVESLFIMMMWKDSSRVVSCCRCSMYIRSLFISSFELLLERDSSIIRASASSQVAVMGVGGG